MTASSPALIKARRTIFDYRAIWRWHFYAGLFCAPFVIILAITGSIYLFKPQVEAWLDRPYDHLTLTGKPVSAQAQVDAALKAVPGSRLRTYEVRREADDAARVVVGKKGENILVYVHPETLRILKVINQDDRLMDIDKTIHGELLMGDNGSILVELAACWAIVMVVTGLYLWWPRQARGLGGVLYPRLGRGSKLFWRDLHAMTGVWISGLALFLLLTGLPWAKVWGDSFKEVRRLTGTAVAKQDWSNGRAGEKAERKALDASGGGEHAGHMMGMDMAGMDMSSMDMSGMAMDPTPPLDRMVATVRALDLPPPVLIAPPSRKKGRNASPDWTARSDTPNRPHRVTLTLDPDTAQVIRTEDFASRHPIDRVIGYGIAAHEGQLFGLANQLLGVLTALGLITLSVSGLVIWWRRRPEGQLGAPPALPEGRIAAGVGVLIVVFGVLLPVLGISMIAIALIERLALRHIPGVRHWLGLRQANPAA
ncbi:PepSY-associated TM helix domain-containing protein [Caulobacter sp.]|uniref:PepSY-associated TM helix domain-containing protein n=1 Tax=Caulobacter sp. TaxID=78 RepID=UPI003BAA48F7